MRVYSETGFAAIHQSMPTLASINTSFYMVYPGYQDYFFGIYNKELTPKEAFHIVESVVDAITDAVKVSQISLVKLYPISWVRYVSSQAAACFFQAQLGSWIRLYLTVLASLEIDWC